MANPYADLDSSKFWKKAVAEMPAEQIHPKSGKRFTLGKSDVVATAGSCFAQHVAKYLRAAQAVQIIEAETLRPEDPVFSGRFANIYTARQMLQLFDEVQSGTPDTDCALRRRADGRWVDIYRPFIEPTGFDSAQDVIDARTAHIMAIAPIFKDPDAFVFTLGLTEGWENPASGKVYPICPGVYSDDTTIDYRFHNFSYEEILVDMTTFITRMSALNPGVNVLLTVSPVPLTATYAADDVMTATMLSKSVLRAVCGALEGRIDNAYYFPSYEMVANPFTAQTAYADNLRGVRPDVIDAVMKRFEADYIGTVTVSFDDDDDAICDDVEIEHSMGF